MKQKIETYFKKHKNLGIIEFKEVFKGSPDSKHFAYVLIDDGSIIFPGSIVEVYAGEIQYVEKSGGIESSIINK